jgi:hypothetical protein
VERVSYRTNYLRPADIFIERLPRRAWPRDIETLVASLEHPALDPSSSVLPRLNALTNDPLRGTAAALAERARRYRSKGESEWMDFNKNVLSPLDDDDRLVRSQDVRFDSTSNIRLTTPVPDLCFGLATNEAPLDQANPLSDKLLEYLMTASGIEPFITSERHDFAFPCVIYEAESDAGNLYAAENQVSKGAAQALAMIRSLRDVYQNLGLGGARTSERLPVIAMCSQGPIYEVFVAFDLHAEELPVREGIATARPGVHLVEIWTGSVHRAEVMYQFQTLLQRVLNWILATFRPAIINMINTVKASTP